MISSRKKTNSILAPNPHFGNATFTQLIHHSNASVGTFSQRYWWNTEFWGGPGAPIIFYTPGESSAEYFLEVLQSNYSIIGLHAQAVRGAMIMIEHRYWGESSPFQVLDTKNMTYLTLNNSIEDLVHFARTARLPFDHSGKSNAPKAPWVLFGISYPGALSAWTSKLSPGTFWAHHASSAPVEAIRDFWQYYEPIRSGMPRNCSDDFELMADHFDQVFARGNGSEIVELKAMFGLENLASPGDVAQYSLLNLPESKTDNGHMYIVPTTRYARFYRMCDTIQGARPVNADDDPPFSSASNTSLPNPVDLTKAGRLRRALVNFAAWWKHDILSEECMSSGRNEFNSPNSIECFNTQDPTSPIFTDLSVSIVNGLRPWMWLICNEAFGWWQTGGAPVRKPSLVPRAINVELFTRQCPLYFPPQGNAKVNSWKIPEVTNLLTDGWYLNTPRVLWVDGEFDPWRSASVSSNFRKGGPRRSTPDQPVLVIKGGRHGNDLWTDSGESVGEIGNVQGQAVSQMFKWVNGFYDVEKRRQAGWGWLEPCKGDGSFCGGNLSKRRI
ncbi:putative serine protease EDA2 [Cladorrhinum sp. PSN259]|nr:putative serine protease EDA2 [Cladorrhinum sp. PSN259]